MCRMGRAFGETHLAAEIRPAPACLALSHLVVGWYAWRGTIDAPLPTLGPHRNISPLDVVGAVLSVIRKQSILFHRRMSCEFT